MLKILQWDNLESRRKVARLNERRGSVVVSTSALYDRVLSSTTGLDMGTFGIKTWLATLEIVYFS